MTVMGHREATGLDQSAVHRHDTPEWMHKAGSLPSGWTLSPAFHAAWSEYMAALQRQSALDAEAQHLNSYEAEREALAADEKAAADDLGNDDVPMVNLDRLAQDRRRGAVKRGAAARAADACLSEVNRLRWAEAFEALDPNAQLVVSKARERALKLVAELGPLLSKLAEWRAAQVWTTGEPAIPERDAQHLAEAIASSVYAQEVGHV